MSVPMVRSALLSAVPGVVHGFTGREGGVSAGHLASLNLATTVGDERRHVDENRARVLAELGRPSANWVSLRQVHGVEVVQVTRSAGKSIEADGAWTRDHGAALAVLTADCLPILLADRTGRCIATVHAGWRGTEKKIVAAMVARLAAQGIAAAQLVVAIGPGISMARFEIGPEVADGLRAAYPEAGEALRQGNADRWHADLAALNRRALSEAGVPADQIEVIGACTFDDARYYSHRRDQGLTGRQAGVIAFAA